MPTANGQLPPLSSLFSRTWEIYRNRFFTLLGIEALPFLFLAAIVGVMFLAVFYPIGSIVTSTMFIGSIAWYVSIFWSQVALIHVFKNPSVGIVEAYRGSYKLILPYFWVALVGTSAVYGGTILLIIPGIIISLWLYVGMTAVAAGDARGLGALALGREVLRDRWFPTFGRILACSIVMMLITVPTALFAMYFGGIIFYLVVLSISMALALPFGLAYGYVLYTDLKTTHKPIENGPRNTKTILAVLAIFGVVVYIAFVAYIAVTASFSDQNHPSNSSEPLTDSEAVDFVRYVPEVDTWLEQFCPPAGSNTASECRSTPDVSPKTGGKPVVEIVTSTDDLALVHVYEELPDHSASFGWYEVNKQTGVVLETDGSASGAPTISSMLVGSWKQPIEDPECPSTDPDVVCIENDSFEMNFAIVGDKRTFTSFYHHRPYDTDCTWDLLENGVVTIECGDDWGYSFGIASLTKRTLDTIGYDIEGVYTRIE